MAATPTTTTTTTTNATTSGAVAPKTAYALFLHRSELKRRRLHFAKVSQTKIHLTDQLISKLKQRMGTCSYEDLQIMVRELDFRKFLEYQLQHRMKQLKALQKKTQVKKVKRLQ